MPTYIITSVFISVSLIFTGKARTHPRGVSYGIPLSFPYRQILDLGASNSDVASVPGEPFQPSVM